MAVPKRRKSKSRVRTRRAHHFLLKPQLLKCKNCGTYIRSHRVCPECGFYKNSVVIPRKVKKSKESGE